MGSFIESRFNKIMAESCAESWENNEGGWCEGGFETLMIGLSFFLGLPILFCIFWCYYTKKRDRENLEMIERQDQEAMQINNVNYNNPAIHAQQTTYGQPQSYAQPQSYQPPPSYAQSPPYPP